MKAAPEAFGWPNASNTAQSERPWLSIRVHFTTHINKSWHFIHKRANAFRDLAQIVELRTVEVELLDTIWLTLFSLPPNSIRQHEHYRECVLRRSETAHFPPESALPPCKLPAIWIPQQTSLDVLTFFAPLPPANALVQELSNGKLSLKLLYCYSVILQEQKSILWNCFLCGGNQTFEIGGWSWRRQLRELDGG